MAIIRQVDGKIIGSDTEQEIYREIKRMGVPTTTLELARNMRMDIRTIRTHLVTLTTDPGIDVWCRRPATSKTSQKLYWYAEGLPTKMKEELIGAELQCSHIKRLAKKNRVPTTENDFDIYTESDRVRKNLNNAYPRHSFPDLRFSVKINKYAARSSITVKWTEGPAKPEVLAHLKTANGLQYPENYINLSRNICNEIYLEEALEIAEQNDIDIPEDITSYKELEEIQVGSETIGTLAVKKIDNTSYFVTIEEV